MATLDSVIREGLSRKGPPVGKWTSPESVREEDSRQECVQKPQAGGELGCLG